MQVMCLLACMPLKVAPVVSQTASVDHICKGTSDCLLGVGLVNVLWPDGQTRPGEGEEMCVAHGRSGLFPVLRVPVPGVAWARNAEGCITRLCLFPESVRKLGGWVAPYQLPLPGGCQPLSRGLLIPQLSLQIPTCQHLPGQIR